MLDSSDITKTSDLMVDFHSNPNQQVSNKQSKVTTLENVHHPNLIMELLKTSEAISSEADDYLSHFHCLSMKNEKGQARYRCVTCHHEFESSTKIRLIRHIIGYCDRPGVYMGVRSCSKPHLGLQENLQKLYPHHPGCRESHLENPNFRAMKPSGKRPLPPDSYFPPSTMHSDPSQFLIPVSFGTANPGCLNSSQSPESSFTSCSDDYSIQFP